MVLEGAGIDGDVPRRRIVDVVVPSLREGYVRNSSPACIIVHVWVGAGVGLAHVERVQKTAVVDSNGVVCAGFGTYSGTEGIGESGASRRNTETVHAGCGIRMEEARCRRVAEGQGRHLRDVPGRHAEVQVQPAGRGDGVAEGMVEWICRVAFNGGETGLHPGRAEEYVGKPGIVDETPAMRYKFGISLWMVDRAAWVLWFQAKGCCGASMGSGEEKGAVRMSIVLVVHGSPRTIRLIQVLMGPHVARHHDRHGIVDDQFGAIRIIVGAEGVVQVGKRVASLHCCAELAAHVRGKIAFDLVAEL